MAMFGSSGNALTTVGTHGGVWTPTGMQNLTQQQLADNARTWGQRFGGTGFDTLYTDPIAWRAIQSGDAQTLNRRAKELRVNIPNGYTNDLHIQNGQIALQNRSMVDDWLAPAATLAAGGVMGAGLLSGLSLSSLGGGGGGGASSVGGVGTTAASAAPNFVSNAVAGTASAASGGGGGVLGFLSKIPSLVSKVGGWSDLISTGADMAGKFAEGRAAGRAEEGVLANQTDRTILERYLAALQASRFDAERRPALAREAGMGSILKNIQDVNVTAPEGVRMGTITGGLKPSIMANRGEIGDNLEREAMLALLSTKPVTGAPAMPEMTERPKASWVDTALNGVALAGGALDAYGALKPKTTTPPVVARKPIYSSNILKNAGVNFGRP